MRVRAHHPRDLARRRAALVDHDQVEELIREGKPAPGGLLEGDATLGVEADPRARRSHLLGRWIRAPHPRRGELAGEEEHRLTVTAAADERPLGSGNVEHRGSEPGQGGVGHQRDDRNCRGRGPIL